MPGRATRASLHAADTGPSGRRPSSTPQSALAAAAERTRIARELHDVVAHHVSLMAVQSEAATSLLPDRPDRPRAQPRSSATRPAGADRAAKAARGAARAVRAPSRPRPRLHCRPRPGAGSGAGRWPPGRPRRAGAPYPLAPGIDLTAYRIVQEALTNTLRHTMAARGEGDSELRAGSSPSRSPTAARPRVRVSGPPAQGSGWPGSPSGSLPAAATSPSGHPPAASPSPPGCRRYDRAREPEPIRVLVVDDQELVRAGFSVILEVADGITRGRRGRRWRGRRGAGRRAAA